MNDGQNDKAKILTVNGEEVTPEMEKDRREQLSKVKAELDALLEKGEIDGIEYNKRVMELEIPREYKAQHRLSKKQKLCLFAGVFLVLAVIAIPGAIQMN